MAEPVALLAFTPSADERAVIDAVFRGIARVNVLPAADAAMRRAALQEASVLISRAFKSEIKAEELPLLAHLRLLQTISAGFNHLPFASLPAGLPIAYNAGGYAAPMAEHVLAMALASAKWLAFYHDRLARNDWARGVRNKRLAGGTCGILGFGGIGQESARLFRAIGMKVHAINRTGRTDQPVDFIGTAADTEKVLRAADVVILAFALNPETNGAIGARQLGWMKKDAILVNVARGEVIQQKALYDHLKANPDFHACLDVWWTEPLYQGTFAVDHPFFNLPNFMGSPHNSAHTDTGLIDGLRLAVENAARVLRGEAPRHLVPAADRI